MGAVLLLAPFGGDGPPAATTTAASTGTEPPPATTTAAPQTAAEALVDDLLVGWTRLDASLGAGHAMMDVAAGEGVLVSVGWAEDHSVWTSEDGQAWTLVPYDDDWTGRGGRIEAIAASDTGFVVVGTQNAPTVCDAAVAAGAEVVPAVWTSPDGFTWSPIPCEQLIPDVG